MENMRKKTKQLLSILLCICMVLSLMPGVPLAVFASDTNESDAVAQAAGTYTVYCINSNKWSKVNAYAWTDNAGNASNWPGTGMTKTGKTVYGYDIYEITFNTAYQKVIFNNGSSQTGDLTFKNGQYFDLKSNTWYASLEDMPSPGVLAGSFNGWSSSANKFKMDAATPSIGYVSLKLAANTKYEFKVIKDGSWLSSATPITGTVEKLTFSSSVSGNATITTTIEGTYVFAFSFTDSKLSVTYPVAGCDHVDETIAGKDATCTEDGLTDGVKCSVCGEILTAQETIPATGHNFVDGTCTVCGEAKYMTIYFQNNWKWTDVELYYWGSSIDKNPEWPGIAMELYGNDGIYDIYMLKVPTDITAMIVNGIKDDGSGTRDQSPDIESGWYDGICYYMYWADGNQVKTEHIDTILPPACNHVEQTIPGYAATCTEPGLTDGVKCSVCDEILTAQEVIPAGHKLTQVEAQAPTCTEAGWDAYEYCTECDYTTKVVIPAGHNLVHVEAQAPTCTEAGWDAYEYCTECDYTTKDEIPATGNHIDADNSGRCDTCQCLMQPAKLIMATMTLEGNIGINFYMLLSDEILADDTAYVRFTPVNADPFQLPVADGVPYEYYGETLYMFTCYVNAKEMTDTVKFQLFYAQGATVEYTYSVKEYAQHVMDKSSDEELKELVQAMVNYGAASQVFFEYNTENLANAGLATPNYEDVVIDGFKATPNQGTDLAVFYAASLILKSNTTLRFFFQVDESVESFTVTCNGQALEVGQRSGLYFVDVVGIAAADLDENVTITINDGTETADITFNPMSYCQGISEHSDDQALKDLVAALYLYNQVANNYFKEA